MSTSRFTLLLSLLLLTGSLSLASEYEAKNCKISLLTFSPGKELYSLFGHSAIKVSDTVWGGERYYNYGTFDFDQPNFYSQFMRGNLNYYLSEGCFSCMKHTTAREKRSLIETPLQFSEEETRKILDFLEWNALPENRNYFYDFQYDNCSNRILQVFLQQSDTSLMIETNKLSKVSFRHMLDPFLENKPWVHTGIDLLLGSRADREVEAYQASFLPDQLHLMLRQTTVIREGEVHKLAKADDILLRKNFTEEASWLRPGMIFWLISLLIVLSVLTGKIFRKIVFTLGQIMSVTFFLLSIFIIGLWIFAQHDVFDWNSNLLWANPLLIFVLFQNKQAKSRLIRILLISCFVLSLAGIVTSLFVVRNVNLTAIAVASSLHVLSLITPANFLKQKA